MNHHVNRSLWYIILFALLFPLLSGCWDRVEIEKQAHVIAIGLDQAEGHLVDVTFQIANPQVGTTDIGQSEKEPPSDVITLTAPGIVAAKETASTIIPRRLNFAHFGTMIVSEELARTSKFHHVVSASTGDPEQRREVNIIITKERASEFIHANKPKLETRPHKYYDFMELRWRDSGHVPSASLNHYYQRLWGELFLAIYATTEKKEKITQNSDSIIAGQVPQKGGDPVQMAGSAIFTEGKMVGTLTAEETRMSLILRNKEILNSFITTVKDPLNPDRRITVRFLKERPTKVKINAKRDPTEIDAKIKLKVQILNIESLTDYVLNLENQAILKQSIEQGFQKNIHNLIKKIQRKYKGEPFNWALIARRQFFTLEQYEQYDWIEKFKEAKINIEVNTEIESFGKQFTPPQVKKHKED